MRPQHVSEKFREWQSNTLASLENAGEDNRVTALLRLMDGAVAPAPSANGAHSAGAAVAALVDAAQAIQQAQPDA